MGATGTACTATAGSGPAGPGGEYAHVAIDDCARLADAEGLPSEPGLTTAAFTARALAWCTAPGIEVRRLLTDNGAGYRSRILRALLASHGIRHRFTRPYPPQTNGKAERFIRTLVHEWAYAQASRHSRFRAAALPPYLRFYNTERRHGALGFTTPAQRLFAKR